jgi:hypothetical protein
MRAEIAPLSRQGRSYFSVPRVHPMKEHNNKESRGSIFINSPGGVGSYFFIEAVKGLKYKTNAGDDSDGLKHSSA